MSETVALALQLLDEERSRETRLFIRMMDLFFDAVNVRNPVEGHHKRKPSRLHTAVLQMKASKVNSCNSSLLLIMLTH